MKRKFIKSGVRVGAAAMAVVVGSGSILLSDPTVVYAKKNEVVQESVSGTEIEEMTQPEEMAHPEETPKAEETTEIEETQPQETKPENNIQEELQKEEISETEVSKESEEAEEVQVLAERVASPGAVINENTVWNYLDNNTDPAENLECRQAWTTQDFNDSSWKSTAGRFGAKKGELVSFDGFTPTVLLQQYIDGTKTDIPTFFFRTKFNIENLEEVGTITGRLFHDDGVVVYLNGHEIHRAGMTVKNNVDPATTNMYYAGENGGEPQEANIKVTEADVQKYAVKGENILAVELHNDRESSSDIYLEFVELMVNSKTETPQTVTQKSVFLTVGSDESNRNLTWYADATEAGEVQYAEKGTAKDGEFPEKYETVKATVTAANDKGFYSNQATLANLKGNTEYVYRVKNGEMVSDTYSFKTGAFDGSFKFALVGDPQIGAGSTASDIEGWNATVGFIKNTLNSEFVLSAGDQVNKASNEEQYTGYLNETFAGLPSATSIGNHDSSSVAYQEHFNLPNESGKGATTAGSDYWYVYGNTLFMVINTNNKSAEEHKAFMEEAIAANKDVKWKTVVFHHSVYSTASHVNDSEIVSWRKSLPPIFEELGIDVVLMGHDHVYTRTYMMDGKQQHAEADQKAEDKELVNPKGTLYLTANSASGSKYYDIKAADAAYSAKMDQSRRRTVTDIEVTDTTYTVKTYFADDMSVLDEFTIKKETPVQETVDKSKLEAVITDAAGKIEKDYTAESWKAFKEAYEAAKKTAADKDATQKKVDEAKAALETAMNNLVKEEGGKPTPEIVDKSKLEAVIKEAGEKAEKDYTAESWKVFKEAYEVAQEVEADKDATQEEVDEAKTVLETAMSKLVKKAIVKPGNDVNNGKPDTNVTSGVKTGDSSKPMFMSLLMLVSGSLVALVKKKRKLTE